MSYDANDTASAIPTASSLPATAPDRSADPSSSLPPSGKGKSNSGGASLDNGLRSGPRGGEDQAGTPANDIDSAHVVAVPMSKPTSTASSAAVFDTRISVESLELIGPLDKGSFGAVYHMRHLGSDVAVKVIPVDGPRAQRDILKEVEMLRRMSNPNVVQFYGTAVATDDQLSRLLKTSYVGNSKESVLMVTELARSGSLYDFYYENEDEYVKPWLHRVDLGKQRVQQLHPWQQHGRPGRGTSQ